MSPMSPRTASAGNKKWISSVRSLNRRLEAGEEVAVSKGRDLLQQKREQEARYRLYQQANDIWLRLSASERNAIRKQVRQKSSLYKNTPDFLLESSCISLIKEQLKQVKTVEA